YFAGVQNACSVWLNDVYLGRHEGYSTPFEMEIPEGLLRDGENTMALTLLRCIGELGDWGYFPTPDAQCKGEHTLCYSIIPFNGDTKAKAYHEGFTFHGDPLHAKQNGKHQGAQPAQKVLVTATGDYMSFVAMKKAEVDSDAVIRFYNASDADTTLTFEFPMGKKAVSAVNLAEDVKEELDTDSVTVAAKKIVSYKLSF
ncbi:MAG: hypothetical protein IKM39_03320, partial [Clostridia bacterium]|nr:hypothetical protein [Clostridia bacterium]